MPAPWLTLGLGLALFTHLTTLDVPRAWAVAEGRGVVIAVIDDGVDDRHPALAPAIVDPGRDLIDGDDHPFHDAGHGTSVAALALGRPFGVARAATLLPIRAMNAGGGQITTLARAIYFAVDHGARVINLSAGVTDPAARAPLLAAVAYAAARDVLIVTAAGNGDPATGLGFDLERTPVYPASLRAANVLVVAAGTAFDPLAPYSNFGRETVDVTAPGGLLPDDPLWSAAAGGRGTSGWIARAGTSFAAPLAAGVAALVRGLRPDLSAAAVRELVSTSGPVDPELTNVTRTGRRLNAFLAVERALGR